MAEKQPTNATSALNLRDQIDIESIIKRWGIVENVRKPWETKWNIIQDQVFPNHDDYSSPPINPEIGFRDNRGIRNHSCAVIGKINRIVSQLNALLADPSTQWLGLDFSGVSHLMNGGLVDFSNSESSGRWLTICKESLYKLFSNPRSNFYPSTYSLIFDWFTLGTACREITLSRSGEIIFNCISMRDIFVEISGYGDIKHVYRRFELTAEQAYDLWGENLHPSQIMQLQQHANQYSTLTYIEVVMENPFLSKMPTAPYISCVIDKNNRHVVDIKFHLQFPYVVSRFVVKSGEAYGRSYVWDAMPDILVINKLSKMAVQNADYLVNPPMLVKDASSLAFSRITPRAVIQGLDSAGRPSIMPLNMLGGNAPFLMEYYQYKLNDLDEALMARDIFTPEAPGMTATEVMERKIQASNRIRPMLVRFEREDLNSTIIRTLCLLDQIGMLPQFPYQQVADEMDIDVNVLLQLLPLPLLQIKVQFSGQMAKMQKMQELRDNEVLLQKVIQAAQIDPSVLDRFNLDALIMEEIEVYDINPAVINDAATVKQIRDQRAAAQRIQQEQQMQQAQRLALENGRIEMENQARAEELGSAA
jgi:hypothetical protein